MRRRFRRPRVIGVGRIVHIPVVCPRVRIVVGARSTRPGLLTREPDDVQRSPGHGAVDLEPGFHLLEHGLKRSDGSAGSLLGSLHDGVLRVVLVVTGVVAVAGEDADERVARDVDNASAQGPDHGLDASEDGVEQRAEGVDAQVGGPLEDVLEPGEAADVRYKHRRHAQLHDPRRGLRGGRPLGSPGGTPVVAMRPLFEVFQQPPRDEDGCILRTRHLRAGRARRPSFVGYGESIRDSRSQIRAAGSRQPGCP